MLMPEAEVQQVVDCLYVHTDIREALQNKQIVLTGAGGFLGRWLTPVLCRLGARVTAIESSELGCQSLRELDFGWLSPEIWHMDLLDQHARNSIDMILKSTSTGYIIHMAGIASPQQYSAQPLAALALSYEASKLMLDLAKETNSRYLFFSSSEIYGDPEPSAIPTPESYPGRVSCNGSRSMYDEGKRVGETLAAIYTRDGLHTNVVRPFNVYGPGMLPTDFRVLPNFAQAVLSAPRNGMKPMQVYGSGKQTRTYCYVTDFIDGIVKLLVRGHHGHAYNIGNNKPEINVETLAIGMQRAAMSLGLRVPGYEMVPHPASYPSDEPSRRCPDLTRARQLGYEPQVQLEDGLARFLEWADKEPSYGS